MKPEKDRVKDLLRNWKYWALDVPADSAEVYYYTVSPMFREYVKPSPSWARYDEESALMVEAVLAEMFKTDPEGRRLIQLYWLSISNERALAEYLKIPNTTLHYRLVRSRDSFASTWGELFF